MNLIVLHFFWVEGIWAMKLLLLLVLNHALIFANVLKPPAFELSNQNFENITFYSLEGEQIANFSNILLKNTSQDEFVSLLNEQGSIKIGAYILDAQSKKVRYQRIIRIK